MNRPPPTREGGRTYAREIERRWSRLHERPVVLSPKDWALIADWHARRVPLTLIEESMRAAGERRGEPPRSLAYIAPAVEEAWALVLDGRRRDAPPAACSAEDPRARWRSVAREHHGSPLAVLLEDLLDRLAAGEDAGSVEERLDRDLSRSVDPGLLSDLTRRVERELAPFAERMSRETLAETTRAALAFQLRRELGLPRLVRA